MVEWKTVSQENRKLVWKDVGQQLVQVAFEFEKVLHADLICPSIPFEHEHDKWYGWILCLMKLGQPKSILATHHMMETPLYVPFLP